MGVGTPQADSRTTNKLHRHCPARSGTKAVEKAMVGTIHRSCTSENPSAQKRVAKFAMVTPVFASVALVCETNAKSWMSAGLFACGRTVFCKGGASQFEATSVHE